MKVWTDLTPDEIRSVASSIGVKIHSDWANTGIRKDGRAWNFRLALDSGVPKRGNAGYKYQRVSVGYNEGRKVAAVCWHGHRDFMRAIFKHDPEARIKTGYYVRGGSTREERREARDAFDYKGHRDFEHKFPKTAHINIGSMMYPGFPIDACTCRQGEWGVDHNVGGTYAVSMERTMIQGCPHVIFTPDHYRADGSCKCNEKDNSDMKEWGYTWNEQQEVWTC